MNCGNGMQDYYLMGWDRDRGLEQEFTFHGQLLASESSHSKTHQKLIHDWPGEYAPQGDRCSACRWFEVRIYRRCTDEGAPHSWVVETVGETIVPGENTRRQVRVTDKPRRVLSMLVQQRGSETFLPAISKRVLDRAADLDDQLAEVVDELITFD